MLFIGVSRTMHCAGLVVPKRGTFTTPLPEAARAPFTLFEDAEGSLWIGSETGLVQAFRTPVRTIVPDAPPREQSFYPIAEDVSGRLWGGTQGGTFRIERERFVRFEAGAVSAILRAS